MTTSAPRISMRRTREQYKLNLKILIHEIQNTKNREELKSLLSQGLYALLIARMSDLISNEEYEQWLAEITKTNT